MRSIVVASLFLALCAALELWLGVNDTGWRIALAAVMWFGFSVPVSLLTGKLIRSMRGPHEDD